MTNRKIVKYVIIKIVRFYQVVFSPDKGFLRYIYPTLGACNMYPTCSEYMIIAVEKYGVFKGVFKGVRRVLRCHPYQKKLIDIP